MQQRSAPDGITGIVRRLIMQGQLQPGQALNQTELAARLGVSRIPLREALRTLAAEGLVVIETGLGASVTRLAARDALDLYDLRLALEPALAPMIIENAGPRDLKRLRSLSGAMEACQRTDQQRFSDLNLEFHRGMYEIADKPMYVRFVYNALGAVEPYSRVYLHLLGGAHRAQSEHAGMVEAIAAKDPDRLRHLIERHLIGARDAVPPALSGRDADAGEDMHLLGDGL